ncbi:probable electron transfer flavoprotein subunit beta [Monosporozyma unispora]|nr:hypothetical protein C6P44_005188 [Kazachstania unispora]
MNKLKVLVPVKRVLDYQLKPVLNSAKSGIETTGFKFSINPFDDIAIEEALNLQSSLPKGSVTTHAVSIDSNGHCRDILKNCLAKGIQDVTWINTQDTPALEPLAIAKILKQFVTEGDYNMVLLGKQAIDDDSNHTGQMLAGLLNWPQLTNASKVEVSKEKLDMVTVTSETDQAADQVLNAPLPCVITADLRLNTPRYVSLPKLMKVKRKPIKELTLNKNFPDIDVSQRLNIVSLNEPELKKPGIVVGSVDELITKLKESKLI